MVNGLISYKIMIKKIIKLISHPQSEYKKIVPFFQTKMFYANIKKAKINQHNEFTRLKADYSKYNPIRLHIGCGPRILKSWINIDLSLEPYKKYEKKGIQYFPEEEKGNVDDFYAMNILETGLPLPDNSVDAIFHEDFIEHIDQKEQVIFLAETLRVLKVGSVHRINTPDLLKSMGTHSDFSKGKAGVYVGEWDKWTHQNILTKNYLKEIAFMIGYRDVVFSTRNKSVSNIIPTEFKPGADRAEDGNLFVDLIK